MKKFLCFFIFSLLAAVTGYAADCDEDIDNFAISTEGQSETSRKAGVLAAAVVKCNTLCAEQSSESVTCIGEASEENKSYKKNKGYDHEDWTNTVETGQQAESTDKTVTFVPSSNTRSIADDGHRSFGTFSCECLSSTTVCASALVAKCHVEFQRQNLYDIYIREFNLVE